MSLQPETQFRRTDTQFFHSEMTRGALDAIKEHDSLVIFCGAGVTIDRTGLSWSRLIEKVFAPLDRTDSDYPSEEEVTALLEATDPVRVASILAQYCLIKQKTELNMLRYVTPLIQSHLYQNAETWRAGSLATSVADLAIFWASLGRRVTIATTNYDVYLERQLRDQLRIMKGNGRVELPGMRARFAGSDSYCMRQQPVNCGAWIEIVYLHGRVPESGHRVAMRRLVLSEMDYAKTRNASFTELSKLFGNKEAAVLVLGASLTDPPLIEALARTATPRCNRRYALMPVTSTGLANGTSGMVSKLLDHARRRGDLLGVSILLPDFKFQIPQFCRELQISAATSGPTINTPNRYGARLQAWWDEWDSQPKAKDYMAIYETLRAALAEVITVAKPAPSETLRLELWVRDKPTATNRRLKLWATSIGPILDRKALRFAELDIDSENASVKAFCEGRPQHFDVADLHRGTHRDDAVDRKTQRWKSYLSVPVYLDEDEDLEISVGAITIASTRSRRDSCLPIQETEIMQKLINNVGKVGYDVLTTDKRMDSMAIHFTN